MTKFKKGESGNPNGRTKGSVNKAKKELAEFLKDFIDKNIEGLQKSWDELEPKDQIYFLERLFKYVIPAKTEIKMPDAISGVTVAFKDFSKSKGGES